MKLREVFLGAIIFLLLFGVAGQTFRGGSMLGVDVRGEWRLSEEPSPMHDSGRSGQTFILERDKVADCKCQGPAVPLRFYQGANFFDMLMSERSLF